MRIFVALDLDPVIRERVSKFLDGVRGFAPDARWVRAESLHVTLKFIGEQTPEQVEALKIALSRVTLPPFKLTFAGVGFFPNPKAARVFWIGIEEGRELNTLAMRVDEACYSLGLPREDHSFSPHLTLARGAYGSPRPRKDDRTNPRFKLLQEKLAALPRPEFGTMTAREFFLYESQLGKSGSHYTKLHAFSLAIAP